ncbi:Helitron helicase [Phytophthora megakarya]|uniref:Helitron helicase n=1 Tax=Phytophthora megakarya TaxID=4795 RepID=A0A225WPE1_9STRA|nr:Helitron helicase [Phytophthora megakarya]
MIQEVLQNCNDSLEGDHQVIARTFYRVKLDYYWIGLYADVVKHVRSCPDYNSMLYLYFDSLCSIPRIVFISDNDASELLFHLRPKQFPVQPAFAMTIKDARFSTSGCIWQLHVSRMVSYT